jgi:hypothetical protein
MSRLVRQYELGVMFRTVDPELIAAAINELDCLSIDRYKRNALSAAHELCWERESQRLVGAYDALVDRMAPQVA